MSHTIATVMAGCIHCRASVGLVVDGPQPLVCRRCVRALAIVAANPYAVDAAGRQVLLDRSLDVLDLRDGQWAWTASWPGVGDLRTLSGRQA